MKPEKSDIEDATANIEAVKAHIEATTAHTETVKAHTSTGTIKPPFEHTTIAPEKIAKSFLEWGLLPRIHIHY